jgi:hypothetical protein
MKSAFAPPSLQKRENGFRFLPRDSVPRWPDDRRFLVAIFGADLFPLFCVNGPAAAPFTAHGYCRLGGDPGVDRNESIQSGHA